MPSKAISQRFKARANVSATGVSIDWRAFVTVLKCASGLDSRLRNLFCRFLKQNIRSHVKQTIYTSTSGAREEIHKVTV